MLSFNNQISRRNISSNNSKTTTTVKMLLLFVAACLALSGSVEATCTCNDVCPEYGDSPGYMECWEVGSHCPADGISYCQYTAGVCVPYQCAHNGAGCICNVFGCNCNGCNCSSSSGGGSRRNNLRHRGLELPTEETGLDQEEETETEQTCDDYDEYMAMTMEEKSAHLTGKHCPGKPMMTSQSNSNNNVGNIVTMLESLAKTNGNGGDMTCEEFNNAYFDVSGLVGLCD